MAHIPHVFLPPPWKGPSLTPADEQLRHLLKVLRRSPGSAVSYTDGMGCLGEGRLDEGVVERGDERDVPAPSRHRIAVAPPRSIDRCRWIVEKLQELGIARLTWLATAHGQGRPPRPEKARHWAIGALQQSRGAHLLEIDSGAIGELEGPMLVAQHGHRPLWAADVASEVTVLVGPEGDWATGELAPSIPRVGLGPTVLRTETAALTAAVILATYSTA